MKIESKIKEYILKNLYFAEDNLLDDDVSFLESGVVDSTGVMELVAFVHAEFGVEVGPKDIVVENFDSVRKVARFVRRKLSLPEQDGSPVITPLTPAHSGATNR